MNSNLLRGEIIAKGYTVLDFVGELGIFKSTFYRKLKGESEFTANEIKTIRTLLSLSDEKLMNIFFNQKVS